MDINEIIDEIKDILNKYSLTAEELKKASFEYLIDNFIVKNEITNWGTLSSRFYGIWLFVVRFICPICIGSVFLHQLGII